MMPDASHQTPTNTEIYLKNLISQMNAFDLKNNTFFKGMNIKKAIKQTVNVGKPDR